MGMGTALHRHTAPAGCNAFALPVPSRPSATSTTSPARTMVWAAATGRHKVQVPTDPQTIPETQWRCQQGICMQKSPLRAQSFSSPYVCIKWSVRDFAGTFQALTALFLFQLPLSHFMKFSYINMKICKSPLIYRI